MKKEYIKYEEITFYKNNSDLYVAFIPNNQWYPNEDFIKSLDYRIKSYTNDGIHIEIKMKDVMLKKLIIREKLKKIKF